MSSFFRINFPYGIAKNEDGEWMAFNRDYLPLGFSDLSLKGDPGFSYQEYPIYLKYRNLSSKKLMKLAGKEAFIRRDSKGEISTVFLYDDRTNPSIPGYGQAEFWEQYCSKLKMLTTLYLPFEH